MTIHDFPEAPGKPTTVVQDIVENSRIIAETASDAIITIDETSTILFVNRAAGRIFGYSMEEMIGAELTMLMPEYLRHLHRAGLQQYVQTGHKHISWEAVELPGLHKNGSEISLELSFGEFLKNGQRFFTGIARDVTKRKQDERRLALQHSVSEILANASSVEQSSSRLLKTICRNLGWNFANFWHVSKETNELRLADSWHDQATKDTEEFETASRESSFQINVGFPGEIWATKMPLWEPDFGRRDFHRSASAARGNLNCALGFAIMLGEEVLGVIELFSVQTKEPDPLTRDTVVAIGSQIGQFIERKKTEREIVVALNRAREARLEAENLTRQLTSLQKMTDAALAQISVEEVIAESLNRIREVLNVDTVAILLLETEGEEVVAWAAQGLEDEVRLGVRIPVGKGFAGRVVAEARPIIINDVSQADVHNPLIRERGIKSLLGVPLLLEGRPIGVLHVGKLEFAEFTEEDVKLLELAAYRIALAIENARLYQVEKLARAEAEAANQAKDEFLTILSHELRTPLTPIIGWVHMMRNGILADSEFSKVLSVIDRNAYSLKRLINDLLDMSAILSGKMRVEEASVALVSVLEESVETLRPYAQDSKVQIRIKVDESANGVTVKGDRSRLIQAFCNILHNAIKFSGAGGHVQVSCQASATEAVVRIKDQGEGISPEFLPHVFERFRQEDGSRTRAFGGLGLGLALVQSFVEAHKGTVEACSDGTGQGSVFVVTLPRETDQLTSQNAGAAETDAAKTNAPKRILIVEDQPDTLDMLVANFQSQGYEVLSCSSATQALDISSREDFDILISDIGMPEMDGLQLISVLRSQEKFASIPAIALTGYASRKDSDAALQAGFDSHVSKPVDPAALTTAVESLLFPEVKPD